MAMMTKGETLKLCVTISDASAVEFRFGGASVRTASATNKGDVWSISEPTADWVAGNYAWQAWSTLADGSIAVAKSGSFTLSAALAVGDVRTSARKMVEMIEAMMAGNASEGVKSYSINNRSLERYSVAELLQMLSYWKQRAAIELRKEKGSSLLGPRIEIIF